MDPNIIYLNAIVYYRLTRHGQKQQAVPEPEFRPFDLAYLTGTPAKRNQSQNTAGTENRNARHLTPSRPSRDRARVPTKRLFDAKGEPLAQPIVKGTLKVTSWPNRFVANIMLALSFFGFLWPHQTNSTNERHHTNFRMQTPVDNWDHATDGFYSPTRSPGWNDLTGGLQVISRKLNFRTSRPVRKL